MKTQGDDTNFSIDLGVDVGPFTQLSIDSICCENKFNNFEESEKKDFRNANVSFMKTNNAQWTEIDISINQYVTKNQFTEYVNSFINDYDIEMIDLTDNIHPEEEYLLKYQFIIISTEQPVFRAALIGDAWNKIGFAEVIFTDICTSAKIYDFSETSVILVECSQLFGNGVITNNMGQALVAIKNQSVFGEKIYFENTQKDTCNTIFFHEPESIRYMNIRLLNCDQTLLRTRNDNNNDLEFIMIMSVK